MPDFTVSLSDEQAAAVEANNPHQTAAEWAQGMVSWAADGCGASEKAKRLATVGIQALADLDAGELEPIVTARETAKAAEEVKVAEAKAEAAEAAKAAGKAAEAEDAALAAEELLKP